jgi:hypothetical protein
MTNLMKLKLKLKQLAAMSLALSAMTVQALDAPAALIPAGLSPGDQFYIIFVTSTARDATSTDIADYNAFVNTAADLSSAKDTDNASITWRVVAATAGNDQCDPYNGDVSATPIYNLNGVKLANDRADMLDGTIAARVEYDETGTSAGFDFVWTGCLSSGTADAANQLGTATPMHGNKFQTISVWLEQSPQPNTNSHRFYAVSPKLTVPNPPEASASAISW